jgi:hypothetical protein
VDRLKNVAGGIAFGGHQLWKRANGGSR